MATTASRRDLVQPIRYMYPSFPRPESRPKPDEVSESKVMNIMDARTANVPWDLDTHGLALVKPPVGGGEMDLADPKVTEEVYGPMLVEQAKSLTGATRGFLYQFVLRGTDKGALDQYSMGDDGSGFAHSDFGPMAPPSLRRDLVERFGVSEEEARDSELCVLNFWHPRFRPAYVRPLALLDYTSLGGYNVGKELVCIPGRYVGMMITKFTDRVRTYFKEHYEKSTGADSLKDKFADKDAAPGESLITSPTYNPNHRWVFCSDMQPDECWVFKQYDTRPGVAKVAFHSAVFDPFHAAEPEIPDRLSAELRVLLTFPKNNQPHDASKL